MKKYSRRAVNIALASTALIGAIPLAGAIETAKDPSAKITRQWNTNAKKYGQAVTDVQCKDNICSQEFENAIITWSQRTGVKTLTGKENVQAFKDAGGVKLLGALESDSYKHSFCGTSVTTYSNSTRYLVVLAGEQKSQSLDLNGEGAKKWKQDRKTNKACFPAEAKVEVPPIYPTEIPDDLNWDNATYLPDQEALVIVDHHWVGDNWTYLSSYIRAADANGKPVAGSEVFEVPWISDELYDKAGSRWYGFRTEGWASSNYIDSSVLARALGYPTSALTWDGNVSTQQFKYGTATWVKPDNDNDRPDPAVVLTPEGAQRFVSSEAPAGTKLTAQTEYISSAKVEVSTDKGQMNFYYLYDSRSGKLAYINERVYKIYMQDPDKYGIIQGSSLYPWETVGSDIPSAGGSFLYMDYQGEWVTLNTVVKSIWRETAEFDPYLVEYSASADRSETINTWVPQDPATVDWSKARYYEGQQALVYADYKTQLVIKADPKTKMPLAGAKAQRTAWPIPDDDSFLQDPWQEYWGNNILAKDGGTEADYFDHDVIEAVGALGLPTGEIQYGAEGDITYQTQEFEGGTIRWNSNNSQPVVTLNQVGEENLKKKRQ